MSDRVQDRSEAGLIASLVDTGSRALSRPIGCGTSQRRLGVEGHGITAVTNGCTAEVLPRRPFGMSIQSGGPTDG